MMAKKKKAKPAKISKAEKSWNNLCAYGSDKARSIDRHYSDPINDVMKPFCSYYSNGIRGHASGSGDDKPNQQTKDDLVVFYSWCRQNDV